MIQREQARLLAVREFHWPEMTSHLTTPPPDAVHIWQAYAGEAAAASVPWADFLSVDERDRAGRFLRETSRSEFILGRGLLRLLLASCLDCSPQEIRFRYGDSGKPSLAAPDNKLNLQFNLSHSGGHVAIAICCGRQVGLDIESMEALADWSSLAERVLAPSERERINALPESRRREAFYQVWTCKEAYLKAMGGGLIEALPAIEIAVAPDGAPSLSALPHGHGAVHLWTVQAFSPPSGFAGAVAFEEV